MCVCGDCWLGVASTSGDDVRNEQRMGENFPRFYANAKGSDSNVLADCVLYLI